MSVDVQGQPGQPLLILSHGAGGTLDTPLLVKLQAGLTARGITVARHNFPYTEAGRKAPDRAPVLMETIQSVAQGLVQAWQPTKLMLGGKSMGGRMASMLVAEGFAADGLVFLGYPLHPAGRPDKLRREHLADIRCRMLFLSGTRDPLARTDLLEETVRSLGRKARLLLLQNGDHSLEKGVSDGAPWAEAAIQRWIRGGS
ncbi:MAG TPA: alpha/beta family hydrolase [Candidatus Xenobia bacterium]